jgi:hypothetical protein
MFVCAMGQPIYQVFQQLQDVALESFGAMPTVTGWIADLPHMHHYLHNHTTFTDFYSLPIRDFLRRYM